MSLISVASIFVMTYRSGGIPLLHATFFRLPVIAQVRIPYLILIAWEERGTTAEAPGTE
jgi:hypothetical protein